MTVAPPPHYAHGVLGAGRKCRTVTSDNCIGQVDILTGNALGEFARVCAKKGVRRVIQVLGLPNAYDVAVVSHANKYGNMV